MAKVIKEDLLLSSYEPLKNLEKQKCVSCGKMRMYFCYDCRIILPNVFTPQIKVFDYPEAYDYQNENVRDNKEGSTVLVFPSPGALTIEEFVSRHGPIKRFVVLDCTWFQTGVMQKMPQIQGLPCVILKDYSTTFWRPQHNMNEKHLATIEAIYYALKEYYVLTEKKLDTGSFDDLLYWYFFTQQKVIAKREERTGLMKQFSDNI